MNIIRFYHNYINNVFNAFIYQITYEINWWTKINRNIT